MDKIIDPKDAQPSEEKKQNEQHENLIDPGNEHRHTETHADPSAIPETEPGAGPDDEPDQSGVAS